MSFFLFFKKFSKYGYILVLLLAVGISMSSCKSKAIIPFPGRGSEENRERTIDSHLSKERKKILKEAEGWLGTPYKYAGAEKNEGTDCSGMVLRVYEKVTSIKLPRNSAKQAEFCDKIKPSKVKPGDLVFFATGKSEDRISHVGIMLDKENFIHSSSSKGVVISNVTTPYYQKTFICYGKVPGVE